MTTRRFLYEDDSSSTPPDISTVENGFAVITNDGHLHVARSGAWVDITPSGSGGSGGSGDGNLLMGSGAPASGLGSNGDYYLDVSVPSSASLSGPKADGAWPGEIPFGGSANPTPPAASVASQVILPGAAVVGTNVVPPGILVATEFMPTDVWLAAGTAPTGGPLEVRLHFTNGQVDKASIGDGYYDISLAAGSTTEHNTVSSVPPVTSTGSAITDGATLVIPDGEYLVVEVVSANGAADVSVGISGLVSTVSVVSGS